MKKAIIFPLIALLLNANSNYLHMNSIGENFLFFLIFI